MKDQAAFDAVIVGGSYAGLSAALALGRAMRRVLVLDTGRPCNWQTPHSHNFLTQDGQPPAHLASLAREQVRAYPTIEFRQEEAVGAEGTDDNFLLTTRTGLVIQARKLLFATGVRDLLPTLPGFAECWGISVIHCPYCHGYEYRHQPTGILLNGDAAFEQARLIRNWTGQLTVFTDGGASFSPEQQQELDLLGVAVVTTPVQRLVHQQSYLTHVELTDGTSAPLKALYARPAFEQHCDLPRSLGCAFIEAGHIEVNGFQKTSQPGIFAAGDNTTMMRSVSVAVAAGTVAGSMINRELLNPILVA